MDIQEQYKRVFRYCCSHISNPDLAEDLTQETFLRYLEHPEYEASGKPMQYLYTIARNLCIDVYRRHTPEELPDDLADPHCEEPAWCDRIALRSILDSLPREERDIITLRYISELSVSDIAGIYNVSWFSMNRRIKRILKKMREAFGKEGIG